MRKNKLFILSSVLVIISLFATAAACNLCGVPIEIGETTEEGYSVSQREPRDTIQMSRNTEAASEDNNPPVIKEIELMGMDIEFAASEGYFDELPAPEAEGSELTITIEASDEDGDELTYSAYDSLGTSFAVDKIDNNNAEFIWILPVIGGSYTLTIEVSDRRGGTDSYSIDMNFIEPASDTGAVGPSEGAASIVAEQCGTVFENDRVMINDSMAAGDTDDNLQMKGFLGFNISRFHGKTVQEAEINLSHLAHAQFPELFASLLVVKVYDFGDSFDASDFAPGGVTIANIPINSASYVISGDILKNELQRVLEDSSRDYFQIKLGLDAESNDNDDADYIYIYNYEAALFISYLD